MRKKGRNAVRDIRTLMDCDDVLRQGFPEVEEQLSRMPFGKYMLKAYNEIVKEDWRESERKIKENGKKQPKYRHRDHLMDIMEYMNILLSSNVESNIARKRSDDVRQLKIFIKLWDSFRRTESGMQDTDKQPMYRLEAFLHDVGKSLVHMRHPSRGKYLVERLDVAERDRLLGMIGPPMFKQLVSVIAYHDRFGVISTGEASYGILADMVSRDSRDKDVKVETDAIGHIFVVNLVDMLAAIPEGQLSDKIMPYMNDWRVSCSDGNSPLQTSMGKREHFETRLLELSADNEWTIERVSRLLKESYRMAMPDKPERSTAKSKWPDVGEMDFRSPSQQALETISSIQWDDFKTDFAHVVKFDYLLNLTTQVTRIGWPQHCDMTRLAVCLVAVVKKLVEQFADLIRRREGRSRIGIDLGVLRDTPEVTGEIAHLLGGDHASASFGLEWLSQEAAAWPF